MARMSQWIGGSVCRSVDGSVGGRVDGWMVGRGREGNSGGGVGGGGAPNAVLGITGGRVVGSVDNGRRAAREKPAARLKLARSEGWEQGGGGAE